MDEKCTEYSRMKGCEPGRGPTGCCLTRTHQPQEKQDEEEEEEEDEKILKEFKERTDPGDGGWTLDQILPGMLNCVCIVFLVISIWFYSMIETRRET